MLDLLDLELNIKIKEMFVMLVFQLFMLMEDKLFKYLIHSSQVIKEVEFILDKAMLYSQVQNLRTMEENILDNSGRNPI
jgi:hypothetical protein